MSTPAGTGDGETGQRISDLLPLLLAVLVVILSPFLYDLMQWLQQLGSGA